MERLEPGLLVERVDLVGGIIASTIANVNRKKGAPAFKPLDFMPLVEKPKAELETPEQSAARLKTSIAETKKRTRRKRT